MNRRDLLKAVVAALLALVPMPKPVHLFRVKCRNGWEFVRIYGPILYRRNPLTFTKYVAADSRYYNPKLFTY